MAVDSKALYDFRKQVEALKQFRGRGTELISVYVTPRYPLSEITGKLRDEYGQAANIKSKSTQKNVQAALEKIMQYLKTFKQTPENGMAVFAGNVSETEGKVDLQLYSVLPPVPVNVQFYRCESQFVLEPLDELGEKIDTYGLVVMDGKEATVAVLKGKSISVVKKLHSTAHQKVSKGGQCLHEDEMILIKGKGLRPIKEATVGSLISSFDFKKNAFVFSRCDEVFKRKAEKVFELTIENSISIKATPEHLVFVATDERIIEKPVEKLTVGDKLLLLGKKIIEKNELRENACASGDGSMMLQKEIAEVYRIVKLTKKTEIKPKGLFYDLSVPENENYVANGLIVHNSAGRYARLHIEGVEYYYKRIGEAMDVFVSTKNLKGVIIGGPGPAKDDFLKQKPFNYQLKVLGVVDTGYTDEFGLREVLEKSGEIIAGQEAIIEKKLLDEFMEQIAKNGLVAYGYSDVKQAVATKQASKLLVTEGLQLKRFEWECNSCGKEGESYAERSEEKNCECGGKRVVEEEEDLVDELIGLAEQNQIPVEIVSRETAEGSQFYGTFKGLGAFLRYK